MTDPATSPVGATRAQQVHLVAVAPEKATWPTWHTAAWLTVPGELRRAELQILVHGAGYDHRYWDWPLEPARYSYAEWAAARGIATLSIDRIGCGLSSRPPGLETTVHAQADVLRRVVADARQGLRAIPAFDRIVLVGHSLGSIVAGLAAAGADVADAVVLTGYIPTAGRRDDGDRYFESEFVPAEVALPHLAGLVDHDYRTTPDQTRGLAMYWSPTADPAVIDLDERTRGTTTRGELRGAGSAAATILTLAAPTLVLVGQYDILLRDRTRDKDCAGTLERWATTAPATFDHAVVHDSGHNLNLHRNAHDAYELIDGWLDHLPGAASGAG